MSAVLHGARHLKQGIGVPSRQWHGSSPAAARPIHIPSSIPHLSGAPLPPPTPAQRLFSQTRTFFSRFIGHLTAPGYSHAVASRPAHASKSLLRPAHYHSSAQSIRAGFSLPVKHALSRPLSALRLPRAPTVPANVTQVGLGTARAFHSSRPIFQNMVENVPIATRALWEAEWEGKMKKQEARKLRRAKENSAPVAKVQERLKPRSEPIISQAKKDSAASSELDVYFPLLPAPDVTTHLLVPLAPTPTARVPLAAGNSRHRLLPVSEIVSTSRNHELHALRVSTLFSRLDAGNVWDDPGVSVDAYAYGPRDVASDTCERQCTVLRVAFAGWTSDRVRAVVGPTAEEWCALEETRVSTPSTPTQFSMETPGTCTSPLSPLSTSSDRDSVSELDLDEASEVETANYGFAKPSAQDEFIIPTLDFSSSFSEAAHTASIPAPSQRETYMHTASELADDTDTDSWFLASGLSSPSLVSSLSLSDCGSEVACPSSYTVVPRVGLSSSFTQSIWCSEQGT
ncbi:hypothetical protein F5J12DRAFT_823484 [Pisolithus orientalis]|uniref:uncharacterized protein n=1 Tax=Pisolithus orientalis TaxID=936130 RepID=UPI00222562AD|nr:uncharacterized protein F5J12DRAFT_823484 [Pisolithus orientalis]KAI6009418.1 hypothetical protein F5J12DRAFT_823484 [Pisolithus orientalis]